MANGEPALTGANIRYLLVIGDLDRDGRGVRCVDVANALGISKPSVHSMVDSMKGLGLLEKSRYGVIRLTERGRGAAVQYQMYFETLCRHFSLLLTGRQEVTAAAYALLAELAPESMANMCGRLASGDEAGKAAEERMI